ncbi:AIR synthase related protein [Paramaledivibacter caminithermalis]|jgi:hypothetical protein|uniref:Alpha-ribazole kinase n=1 Tax=Paramaledivibacter caminithermalis (strain DSM 15212 / CIP 107654 / DViRD3) TaxID=1121301 RepID=A0A1M6SIC2_PARC5|nr:AIR synthase related protein [Paramaledivibacter caminithermalis]SHK44366.1 alpha-ribazole kinase [Paramaledivibacter caminithermalis DSM 15212]
MLYTHRDVSFIHLNDSQFLAIACDSCGAIGLKEKDIVMVPPNITGKYTTRVCLMEILSIGATPIGITVNICNEPNPTGNNILKGVMDELSEAGFDIPITISTEKNMETYMTALGITIIGIINKNDILIKELSSGDYIYAIGNPSIGNEVLENQALISDLKILRKVLELEKENIKEVIPVGSSGIKGELDNLNKYRSIKIRFINNLKIDINKSAGPCTVIIAISKSKFKNDLGIPISLIGKII